MCMTKARACSLLSHYRIVVLTMLVLVDYQGIAPVKSYIGI